MANRETAAAILGEPLSQAEIEAFVAAWYRKLDMHAPAEELLPLVSEQCLVIQVMEECLEMHFPEGRLNGADEFRRWYEGVIRIFFDEVHTVTRVSASWQDRPGPGRRGGQLAGPALAAAGAAQRMARL